MTGRVRIQLLEGQQTALPLAELLRRKIVERSGGMSNHISEGAATLEEQDPTVIYLDIRPGVGEEGYCIEDWHEGVKVTGHDERGLLYGIGKLLRDADYADGTFKLGSWRGSSKPDKKVRGIYFATHFHNYYHDAPVDELIAYLEDIALWGFNVISVWFDMHHFTSIDDPKAVELIERLRAILQAAKRIGLMTSLSTLGNEAYASSPTELRAEWTKQEGYRRGLGSHYHVELCPSKPGAIERMLEWKKELFYAFADIGIDFVWFFPYDQGGCTCSECRPWGAGGFLKISKLSAAVAKQCLPDTRIVLSTWLFDYFTEGEWLQKEWTGLTEAVDQDASWIDYIMWDYNTTCDTGTDFILDPYLEQHGVPGQLPMIGFPEISMFATQPYGGWGANPQPDYIQSIWDQAGSLFQGGFPYSEGIYEDINKVVCCQLYWDRHQSADDAVKEYIAYEYSPLFVEPILKAIKLMQSTYVRNRTGVEKKTPAGDKARYVIQRTEGIEEAFELLSHVEKQLEPSVRTSWRWRILYLRSVIDFELLHNDFRISGRCEEALEELESLYYADQAATAVAPVTRKARAVYRAQ